MAGKNVSEMTWFVLGKTLITQPQQ